MHSRYCWIPMFFLFFGLVLFGAGCGKQTVNPVTTPLSASVEQKRSEDKDTIYIEYILQLKGEERFFSCSVVLQRYGYDDYGYEDFSQDLDFIEVEKKEVVTYTWVQKT